MASASTCQTQRVHEEKKSSEPQNSNSSKSCFQPTVCLKDWWLIRAEEDSQGRTLAVAGFTSREGQALRGFTSAPILKIYDVFNLETIDGICIVLKGFINKSRSEENGFPSEVIEQFLFGFPPQWQTFNEKWLGRESKGKASANDTLGLEEPFVCSDKVKDLKKLDQKDHAETTGETIQDHNGRKDSEIEDNLIRDSQNDGEIASEVIVQKKAKRAVRSSDKLYSTSASISIAKEQTIQDHNGRKDYEVEDNLMRDNQNDGVVASEVTVQKMRKKAMRSSDKLNSTNASISIAKEQTADVNRTVHIKSSSGSMKNAKRKLSYGSPQKGKEAVRLISAEPSSFNRSRSGRVLLPPMAFWRNERAVYDADQRVTGIKQGDPDLDSPSKVCRSEPSKNRQQCR